VQEFIKYVDKLTHIESNSKSSTITLKQKISASRQQEIREWIQNEQALCALDAMYWATRYAWVVDEQGQVFKFQPRQSQKIYQSIIADFDEKQVSIELLILKGRQLGITTFTALLFLHRMLFIPNTQAIMASVKDSASQLIGRIIDTAYNRCPWWLVPSRMPKKGFDNHSILSIQSGMQATGLAQGWTPTCLVPGSPIRLANGFTKPIEDVTAEDTVITHSGKMAQVKESFQTLRGPDVTRILKLWGYHNPLECTLEHRVKTPQGWTEASEIGVGDYVSHPVRHISNELKKFQTSRMPKGAVREYRREYFDVELSEHLGYLCGFYLAEGTIHESAINHPRKSPYISEVIFNVHDDEVEHRVACIRKVLGKNQHIRVYKKQGKGTCLTIHCAWLGKWIAANFGRTSKKTVPDWAWTAGQKFCHGIVKGYIDGDGHYEKGSNNIIAPSICQQLILQMRDMIASLGFGWSSVYFLPEEILTKYGSHRKDTWRLVLSGPTGYRFRLKYGIETQKTRNGNARHWKYSSDRKSIYLKVESTSNGSAESFYDIEVDHKDHSFTTGQCAVHNCVHLSEIADVPNPTLTIEEGLFRATHTSKNLFMVLEGTGRGNTGWLAETWRKCKEGYPKGVERLCPIFIPWVMCPEIYPKTDWVRKFPVPINWTPHDITRKHIAKAESYIRNTPYLAKIAGANWKMPIEQQWFWQFNYDSACKNHTQKTWAAQMPADDFDSLTGVHDSVFDVEVLAELEENIYEIRTLGDNSTVKERRVPVQTYAIMGHDVDEIFHPDPDLVDYSKEQIRVNWKSYRGQEYEWLMVPLRSQDETIEMNTMDRLVVYEPPVRGNYYAMGVDTADGLGKEDEDRSVLSVTNNRFNGESDYQCAEYTTNKVNSAQIVPFAACIGAWYGKNSPDGKGMKYVIEQIRGPGDTCQHQLKMMGLNNHHKPRRYDSKKTKDDSGNKVGWYSNGWSVPMLMDRFREAVNGGWYIPRSKWLIEELRSLERHETGGKSKMEHRSGQHDDRVRAAAQSYFTAHDLDILTERAQQRSAPPSKKKERPKGPGSANQLSVGDGW
jgi:hypothetical protein